MILTAINDRAYFESYNSRLEELKAFQQKCEVWENTARRIVDSNDPGASAAFKRTDRSMTVKIVGGSDGSVYTESTIVVTMVDDAGLVGSEWLWTDKIIQNSQGGTTHLIGWNLS